MSGAGPAAVTPMAVPAGREATGRQAGALALAGEASRDTCGTGAAVTGGHRHRPPRPGQGATHA